MHFAWPNTFVHDANLKVNIAALRKALRPGSTETRYIATVPGRGYCFVAPLEILDPPAVKFTPPTVRANTGKFPTVVHLIGREQAMTELDDALAQTRLLTIVGAAGVGKTSLAVAYASKIADRFEDGVCYVDLSAIDDPQFVLSAIAFALGRDSNFVNTFAGLAAVLGSRSMMLVLDNCEHLLSAVAGVADYLGHLLPNLSLVATSREPLRCRMEQIYRLSPLLCPPEGNDANATDVMSFSAVQLLVQRAQAQGYRLQESDLPALAAISRRLDGIALAIELAASQLAAGSAATLQTVLESSFATLVSDTDTAPARHKTLMATLDWSYRLLSENEARLLRYLSNFSGGAAPSSQMNADDIAAWLENLASKSLLTVAYREGRRWYRLLDTTRTFASERLRQDGELSTAMIDYSSYLLSRFEQAEAEWAWRTREDWAEMYGPSGNDLRRAIDWSFGEGQNAELGIRLTVAGITLWCEQSSFLENRSRVQTALDAAKTLGTNVDSLKMRLIAVQGINLCQAREIASAVNLLREGIRLANELGNIEYRARMTGLMAGAQFFMGRHREALASLSKLRSIIDVSDTCSVEPDIRWHELMIGFCLGDISHAYDGLEKLAREFSTVSRRSQVSRFVIDRFVAIRTFRAVAAWAIGKPQQALKTAEEAVEAATNLEHAVSSVFVLGLGAIPVALFNGLFDLAQQWVDLLCHNIALIQDEVWAPNARLYQAAIDHARGLPGALERMREAIDEMIESEMLVHAPIRLALLADRALLGDRLDVAEAAVNEGFHYSHHNGEHWSDAELLRLQAIISWRRGDLLNARRLLNKAIQVAQQACAQSFQLRAAINLAELEMQSGAGEDALVNLAIVYRRFNDNFPSADLLRARQLLHDLAPGSPNAWDPRD